MPIFGVPDEAEIGLIKLFFQRPRNCIGVKFSFRSMEYAMVYLRYKDRIDVCWLEKCKCWRYYPSAPIKTNWRS